MAHGAPAHGALAYPWSGFFVISWNLPRAEVQDHLAYSGRIQPLSAEARSSQRGSGALPYDSQTSARQDFKVLKLQLSFFAVSMLNMILINTSLFNINEVDFLLQEQQNLDGVLLDALLDKFNIHGFFASILVPVVLALSCEEKSDWDCFFRCQYQLSVASCLTSIPREISKSWVHPLISPIILVPT